MNDFLGKEKAQRIFNKFINEYNIFLSSMLVDSKDLDFYIINSRCLDQEGFKESLAHSNMGSVIIVTWHKVMIICLFFSADRIIIDHPGGISFKLKDKSNLEVVE